MSFKNVILFMINFVKRTLQRELDDFSKISSAPNITKQAFSQARQKVSPKAFIHMLNQVNKWYYKETPFEKYKEYRLIAIDGTVLEINDTEELRNEFGYIENQNKKVARARASALYDVENDMIICSKLTHYRCGEREIAENLIDEMIDLGSYNDLILFDRGYSSKDFITFIESRRLKYLMRVSNGFLKVVVNAPKPDQIIEVKHKEKVLKMRVIKFELESGIIETLVTNIFDETISLTDFKELYFKRWGIEVKYNEIKNKLQVENFTGKTVIAIEQDFYATMYLTNMVALAKKDANKAIEEDSKNKNLKFEYKVNTNVLIGKLKNTLITMIIIKNPWKRSKILKSIQSEIERNIIPIRPGRKIVRKVHKSTQMENRMNKKRALYYQLIYSNF
ncbi:transposase [Clostridium neonatale]|nr:transposase [Clostridium neonatale]CAI3564472.1 transposase [Clostridium neonatale]CAI3565711.1 transposase [Clostridium neonatale]CAI3586617.1 transposase [Clostridium neonatale]CAI3609897.1 transposase [Clostridium neonatale]